MEKNLCLGEDFSETFTQFQYICRKAPRSPELTIYLTVPLRCLLLSELLPLASVEINENS
jgi:hypothetical protein